MEEAQIAVTHLEVLPDPTQVWEEETMDKIYAKLKEARAYYNLARAARLDAQVALDKAQRSEDRAKQELAEWKAKFDVAFVAEVSP